MLNYGYPACLEDCLPTAKYYVTDFALSPLSIRPRSHVTMRLPAPPRRYLQTRGRANGEASDEPNCKARISYVHLGATTTSCQKQFGKANIACHACHRSFCRFVMSEPIVRGFVHRKRRRAALACELCRRRKVKCDRQVPCGPCALSKTAKCVYSTEPSRVVRDRRRPPGASPDGEVNPRNSLASPSQPVLPNEEITNVLQPTLTKHLTPADSHEASSQSGRDVTELSAATPRITGPKPCNVFDHQSAPSGSACSPAVTLTPAANFTLQTFGQDAVHGSISKTRYFGRSHWMNSIIASPFDRLRAFKHSFEIDEGSEMSTLVQRCKALVRKEKAERVAFQYFPTDFRKFVPPKDISDQLLELYFRTFETVYRVIHIPTFREEYRQYWEAPNAASIAFVMQLLVMLAIGTCFYDESTNGYHKASTTWVYTAQTWLNSPMEKARLNLTGLRVQCLLLLARQTNAIASDLVWIPAGSLLRTAMHMGLHFDPSSFPKISIFDGEMRRRLWATILEILLQSSLDSGMPPLISTDDFDCRPPSNLNDTDIHAKLTELPRARSSSEFTDTTIQIMLIESWSLRLNIAKRLNNFKSVCSYEETLRLDFELQGACRSASTALRSFASANDQGNYPSYFQIKYFDLLTRRFMLSLHRTFANEGYRNPAYYFSRKVCQDAALVLLEPCSVTIAPGAPAHTDDYVRLIERSSGLFRGVFVGAGSAISYELISQLEQDYTPSLPTPMDLIRKQLHQTLQTVVEFSLRRIKSGETNVKSVVFNSCILGQVNALIEGRPIDEAIMQAAREGVQQSYRILEDMLGHHDPGQCINGNYGHTGAVNPNPQLGFGQEMDTSLGIDTQEYDMLLQQNLGLDFDFPDSWLMFGSGVPTL